MEADLEAESIGVLKSVDEGRNYVIQAAIIRCALLHPLQANVCMKRAWWAPPSIMKARKTMSHRSLIEEVISQTSLRFTPQTYDIKKVCYFLLRR